MNDLSVMQTSLCGEKGVAATQNVDALGEDSVQGK